MRVLSLSHRMQHRLVDNHSIFNAPSIFDYDAIVIDVGGVSDTIRAAARAEQEFKTFADLVIVNGEPLAEGAGLADVLRRRRHEFARALDRGAVVAVFARPPALITEVLGFHGLDRYFMLPAPAGMAWDTTTIRGGEGTTVSVTDPDHPFARVIDLLRQDLLYRAYLDERAPGFASSARVFARSAGGGVLGVEFPVLNGRLVFLPTPRAVGASWLAPAEGAAMVEIMREMHRVPDDDPPRWLRDTAVPGLDALTAVEQRARLARERAEADERAAADAAAVRARLRDLLWEGAEYRLLPAIVACAELLGFESRQAADGEVVLSSAEGELHVAAAAATEAVDMSPHYRLRRRLDALIERRALAPRGIVIANGQRLLKPEERDREYIDALRVAAESTGYALLTSRWLFVAAVAALEGMPPETLVAIRRRLMSTNGLVELHDLLIPPVDDDAQAAEAAPPAPTHGTIA